MTIDDLGKLPGGSLRSFLQKQGVTDEKSIRGHIAFIIDTEARTGTRLDLTRYRVNPSDPNAFPPMMG